MAAEKQKQRRGSSVHAGSRDCTQDLIGGGIISLIELTDLVIVVRGGTRELPSPGTAFSGAVGKTVEEAAAYVPHSVIRFTTIGAILAGGGSVTLKPEPTRSGRINERHVEVIEGSLRSAFSEPMPNPIPKADRIQ